VPPAALVRCREARAPGGARPLCHPRHDARAGLRRHRRGSPPRSATSRPRRSPSSIHERLWFKARIGIDQPQLGPRGSLCGHAIDAPNETLVVARLAAHPDYSARRRLRGKRPRFYAGVPLLSPKATRSAWSASATSSRARSRPQQLEGLRLLARQTQHLLELRRLPARTGPPASERDAVARDAEQERDDLQRRHDDLQYAATTTR
jgi:hypothetical protein